MNCHRVMRRLTFVIVLAQLVGIAGCQSTHGMFSWGQQTTTPPPPPANQTQTLMPGAPQAGSTDALTKQQKVNVQMALAHSLERQHKLDEAIGVYQEVLIRDKNTAEAYHRLAILHDQRGKPEKAAEFYRQAIEHDPKNAETYCDLGYSQYLQRRWAESERNYRKAIELKPDMARAHNNLGLLLARNDRQNDALWEFHRAGMDEADARCNMALAMMLEHRWDEANQQCETALKGGRTTPKTREKLDHFESIIAQARPDHSDPSPTATTTSRSPVRPQPDNIARTQPAAPFPTQVPMVGSEPTKSPAPGLQTSYTPPVAPPVAPASLSAPLAQNGRCDGRAGKTGRAEQASFLPESPLRESSPPSGSPIPTSPPASSLSGLPYPQPAQLTRLPMPSAESERPFSGQTPLSLPPPPSTPPQVTILPTSLEGDSRTPEANPSRADNASADQNSLVLRIPPP